MTQQNPEIMQKGLHFPVDKEDLKKLPESFKIDFLVELWSVDPHHFHKVNVEDLPWFWNSSYTGSYTGWGNQNLGWKFNRIGLMTAFRNQSPGHEEKFMETLRWMEKLYIQHYPKMGHYEVSNDLGDALCECLLRWKVDMDHLNMEQRTLTHEKTMKPELENNHVQWKAKQEKIEQEKIRLDAQQRKLGAWIQSVLPWHKSEWTKLINDKDESLKDRIMQLPMVRKLRKVHAWDVLMGLVEDDVLAAQASQSSKKNSFWWEAVRQNEYVQGEILAYFLAPQNPKIKVASRDRSLTASPVGKWLDQKYNLTVIKESEVGFKMWNDWKDQALQKAQEKIDQNQRATPRDIKTSPKLETTTQGQVVQEYEILFPEMNKAKINEIHAARVWDKITLLTKDTFFHSSLRLLRKQKETITESSRMGIMIKNWNMTSKMFNEVIVQTQENNQEWIDDFQKNPVRVSDDQAYQYKNWQAAKKNEIVRQWLEGLEVFENESFQWNDNPVKIRMSRQEKEMLWNEVNQQNLKDIQTHTNEHYRVQLMLKYHQEWLACFWSTSSLIREQAMKSMAQSVGPLKEDHLQTWKNMSVDWVVEKIHQIETEKTTLAMPEGGLVHFVHQSIELANMLNEKEWQDMETIIKAIMKRVDKETWMKALKDRTGLDPSLLMKTAHSTRMWECTLNVLNELGWLDEAAQQKAWVLTGASTRKKGDALAYAATVNDVAVEVFFKIKPDWNLKSLKEVASSFGKKSDQVDQKQNALSRMEFLIMQQEIKRASGHQKDQEKDQEKQELPKKAKRL